MIHKFKIQQQYSDVFVVGIDVEKGEITYEVRKKETGLRLEPDKTEKILVDGDKAYYANRYMDIKLFAHINAVLNGSPTKCN
jgi:hypothetical protein